MDFIAITHLRLFERVREAALVPAPHLGCLFWVLHVSTERHLTGTVTNVDWGPVAGGQEQVYVVPSSLSSHQVLRAAHHLETGMGAQKMSNTRHLELHRGHLSLSRLWPRSDPAVCMGGQITGGHLKVPLRMQPRDIEDALRSDCSNHIWGRSCPLMITQTHANGRSEKGICFSHMTKLLFLPCGGRPCTACQQ